MILFVLASVPLVAGWGETHKREFWKAVCTLAFVNYAVKKMSALVAEHKEMFVLCVVGLVLVWCFTKAWVRRKVYSALTCSLSLCVLTCQRVWSVARIVVTLFATTIVWLYTWSVWGIKQYLFWATGFFLPYYIYKHCTEQNNYDIRAELMPNGKIKKIWTHRETGRVVEYIDDATPVENTTRLAQLHAKVQEQQQELHRLRRESLHASKLNSVARGGVYDSTKNKKNDLRTKPTPPSHMPAKDTARLVKDLRAVLRNCREQTDPQSGKRRGNDCQLHYVEMNVYHLETVLPNPGLTDIAKALITALQTKVLDRITTGEHGASAAQILRRKSLNARLETLFRFL